MSVSTGQAEQAEYLQNDANNSSFVRQRSNSRGMISYFEKQKVHSITNLIASW